MRNPARIGHFRCKSLLKSSGADEMARKRQVFTVVDDENAEGEDAE